MALLLERYFALHPAGGWWALALILAMGCAPSSVGQVLYWDTNSTTAGAGGGTAPSGTWASSGGPSNRRWSTSAAGTASTAVWTSGRDAVFSAGTNATGSYTVTVSGTQNVSSITVQDGTPTFTSGTLRFNDATPDLIINSGRTLNWGSTGLTSSTNTLNISGGGVLNFTSNRSFAGTFNLAGGTLRLTSSSLSLGTLNITGDTIIDFAGTASSLNLTNLSIAAGVVVTVNNWQDATDFLTAANWIGATPDITGTSPMNQIVFTGATMETGWRSFDDQIRPIPEPGAHAAVLLTMSGGVLFWLRSRASARAQDSNSCGTPRRA